MMLKNYFLGLEDKPLYSWNWMSFDEFMTLQKIKTSQIMVKGTNITITNIYLTCLQIFKHKINVENVCYIFYMPVKRSKHSIQQLLPTLMHTRLSQCSSVCHNVTHKSWHRCNPMSCWNRANVGQNEIGLPKKQLRVIVNCVIQLP